MIDERECGEANINEARFASPRIALCRPNPFILQKICYTTLTTKRAITETGEIDKLSASVSDGQGVRKNGDGDKRERRATSEHENGNENGNENENENENRTEFRGRKYKRNDKDDAGHGPGAESRVPR